MTILVTIIHVIVCLILILVILLQAGRGQGLTTSSFGSGNVQSIFGTRAADFLTKATSVAAICFLLTSIGLNIIETQKSRSLLEVSRRQTAPIDVDQLRKALEKVKAQMPVENQGQVSKQIDFDKDGNPIVKAVESGTVGAEATAASVATTAETTAAEAVQTATEATNQAEASNPASTESQTPNQAQTSGSQPS